MEMEKDEKWRKTLFCSALGRTQSVLVSALRWFIEQRRRAGQDSEPVQTWY